MIIVLLCAWVAAVAASFLLSWQIEGPRNIDTGFHRLNVFFEWQAGAFFLAIFAAVSGWRGRSERRWIRWAGFAPILLTVAVIGSIIGYAFIVDGPISAPSRPQVPTAADAVTR